MEKQHVLILGANGQIAKLAEEQLLENTDADLTLFLRNSKRALIKNAARESVVEGDASSVDTLVSAMRGATIVYANLAGGNIEQQAKSVVEAMDKASIKRLIWISTLGIYDEVPGNYGKWNHQMLDGGYLETYSKAAKVIESSDLDYTIIRPAWLSNKNEIDYETTQKGSNFKGTEVSRKSIAALIAHLVANPNEEIHHSLGVNKPNTDGDKPSWY